MPCPKGPVVTSIPDCGSYSGWPGVLLPHCRKFFNSSRLMSKPVRCSSEKRSTLPWPAERTKRSRLCHPGLAGLYFIYLVQSTYAAGAIPIGMPGWPELAFCTASTDRNRIVWTQSSSSSDRPGFFTVSFIANFLNNVLDTYLSSKQDTF